MKRVLLFLATNLAVIVVASITLSLLGVGSFLDESGTGLNLQALLIFCFVFGMAGSFISLLMSKQMVKWTMKPRIIDQPRRETEVWLVDTVGKQAKEAGKGMSAGGSFAATGGNGYAR